LFEIKLNQIGGKMKEQIIKILSELRPEFDFTQSANFIDEGMLDSFDVVTLVTTLDEKFGISISGTDILPENFESVEKIEALLRKNGVKSE
jgi:acyl carrier protein